MAGVVKIVNLLPKGIVQVFEYLDSRKMESTWEELAGPFSSRKGELFIWRGFGQEIADALSMKLKYVYSSMSVLESLGSIKKIRHGAYATPSIYRVMDEPDVLEYIKLKERSILFDRPQLMTKSDRVQDSLNLALHRITVLESKVNRLEQRLDVNRGRYHA